MVISSPRCTLAIAVAPRCTLAIAVAPWRALAIAVALGPVSLAACGHSAGSAASEPGDGGGVSSDGGRGGYVSGDAGANADADADANVNADADSGSAGEGLDGGIGPRIGDFVGLNGFIDDPVALLAGAGNVREYHDWQWSEGNGDSSYPGYPNEQNSFSLFGGAWDWDAYYGGLKTAGVFGYPVIQQGVSWLNGGAVPPVPAGASDTDPASYAAHADEMFQYAARYGAVPVDAGLLKLASGQTARSGLGYLGYIEDWNEEDAWWVLPDGGPVFPPSAYAAMASADCDGDQGRMGKTVGMKNADPNIACVMGGLSGKGSTGDAWELSIEAYLEGVRAWAQAHRGGDFPADVINVHHYSFGPDADGTTNPRPALSPEDDHVEQTLAKLRSYRDANLPGKALWLTEFGYDTDAQSILHAPAIGGASAEIVQAEWIVRTYLAVLAAGFDRAFVYISRDTCVETDAGACPTKFSTAGLTTSKGSWAHKPAYDFVATFRSRLASEAWLGARSSGDPRVSIAAFGDPSSARGAYVVWAPTSAGTVVSGFALPAPQATQATLVTLSPGSSTGTESTQVPHGGTITVDVSESPTIVLVDVVK